MFFTHSCLQIVQLKNSCQCTFITYCNQNCFKTPQGLRAGVGNVKTEMTGIFAPLQLHIEKWSFLAIKYMSVTDPYEEK